MCRCNESDCNNIIGCTDAPVATEPYEIGYDCIHFGYFFMQLIENRTICAFLL